MSDIYYQCVRTYAAEDFPFDTDPETLIQVNKVLPSGYEVFFSYGTDGEKFVDLFKYVGYADDVAEEVTED